jgi:type IV secretory pathway VirB6-like protein
VIVWFGITSMLSGTVSIDRFARLMLTISFGLAMTKFYATPIPGFGYSFYELFTKQGDYLALQLNENMLTQIKGKLEWVWDAVQNPSINLLLAPADLFRWGLVVILVLICYLATTWVIIFGYIAASVCVLLGPVFIPFFIVPQMEWLFWGWLRAMVQYAFYPVVANAFVLVFGTLLVRFIDNAATDFSAMKFGAIIVPTFIVFGTFAFSLMKIPSVVNSLFTGKAGESAMIPIPGIGK